MTEKVNLRFPTLYCMVGRSAYEYDTLYSGDERLIPQDIFYGGICDFDYFSVLKRTISAKLA